jgi:hypothetical protein
VDVGRNYTSGLGEAYLQFNGAHKAGLLQIIEGQNIQDLMGQTVTLSFKARRSVAAGGDIGLNADLLQWVGTEDSPTRDVASNWNTGSPTSGPSFVANWSRIGSAGLGGAESSSLTSYSRTFTIPSSGITNLAVFFFTTNNLTVANDDYFTLQEVQLEIGSVATPFQRNVFSDELARCQRYYEVLRYTNFGAAALAHFRATNNFTHTWYFKAAKRVNPTVTAVTGSWSGATPTINPGIDSCDFNSTVLFNRSGTSGNIALAADAEL